MISSIIYWLCVIAYMCLGTYAGSCNTSKAWRRFGIPILVTVSALLINYNLYYLSILSMIGALSLGYGIPDDPSVIVNRDEGSTLGKLWYGICKGNRKLTDVCMRGTTGLLVSLSLLSIPIISGCWQEYLKSVGIIMGTYITWGALVSGEPTIHIGNKEFLVEDLLIYGTVGYAIFDLMRSI